MQQIWCTDLDGTISAYPAEMKALMQGLRSGGHTVIVLTGHPGDSVTPEVCEQKKQKLAELGVGNCYDKLAVVANPDGDMADMKVAYLRQAGATALIDNDHDNVRAARKAGFLAFRPGQGKENN